MRPATQIDESIVAIRGDLLTLWHFGSVDALDDLHLERVVREHVECFVASHRLTHEWLIFGDDLVHPLLDGFEVLGSERIVHFEVVVEAVFDRRADRKRGLGVQAEDGLREHMGSRVPKHRPTLVGGLRDDLEVSTGGQWTRNIEPLSVQFHGYSGLGESWADGGCDVVAGRTVLVLDDSCRRGVEFQ